MRRSVTSIFSQREYVVLEKAFDLDFLSWRIASTPAMSSSTVRLHVNYLERPSPLFLSEHWRHTGMDVL